MGTERALCKGREQAMKRWAILAVLGVAACGPALAAEGDQGQTTTLEHKFFQSIAEVTKLGLSPSGVFSGAAPAHMSVEWPAFESENAMPSQFYLHGSPGGEEMIVVPIALDATGGASGYNVLYVDRDRDGKFGDGERIEGKPGTDPDMKGGADFGVVAIPVDRPGHGALHLRVWAPPTGGEEGDTEQTLLYYIPWCYLQGEVTIGGTKIPIRIVDVNMDGDFAGYGIDGIAIGDAPLSMLSKLMLYEGRPLEVEVAADAARATVSAYSGETGTIRVTADLESGEVLSLDAWLRATPPKPQQMNCVVPKDGTLVLPPGAYLLYLAVECSAGPKTWAGYCTVPTVEVAAGQESAVRIGKPMSLEIALSESTKPGKTLSIAQSVHGTAQEEYYALVNYPAGTKLEEGNYEDVNPQVVIRNAAGEKVAEGTMEPGRGGPQYSWSIPNEAKEGEEYTIDVTTDTGPLGGIVTGSCKVTLGTTIDPEYEKWEAERGPLEPGAIEQQTVHLETRCFDNLDEATDACWDSIWSETATPDKPAEHVEWPQFVCATPFYGTITELATEHSPEEPLFALDKTDKDGALYDVLYVDLDGDRAFGSGERFVGKDPGLEWAPNTADFGCVSFPPAEGDAAPRKHWIWAGAQDVPPGNAPQMELWGCGAEYSGGKITVAGKETVVRLIDVDGNGTYTDLGIDSIAIGAAEPSTLARMFEYRGLWLQAEIGAGGAELSIGPFAGGTGTIACEVNCEAATAELVNVWLYTGDGATLNCSPEPDEGAQVPARAYCQADATLVVEQEGERWSCGVAGPAVNVAPGERTVLVFGKPMTGEIAIEGSSEAGGTVTFGFTVHGARGESYDAFCSYDSRSRYTAHNPKIAIRNASGEVVEQGVIKEDGGEYEDEEAAATPAYTWTIPQNATHGDEYTVEITLDTGPFAGELKASTKLVVGASPND
jgi:hypothetical protein